MSWRKKKAVTWWPGSLSRCGSGLLAFAWLALATGAAADADQNVHHAPFQLTLTPSAGEPMEFTVAGDSPVVLVVEQHFVDVVVTISGSDMRVDSPTGDGGLEMALIPPSDGHTEIRLETYSPPAGEAQVRVNAVPAPSRDSAEYRAWQAVTRAGQIFAADSTALEARRFYLAASGDFRNAGKPGLAGNSLYNAAAVSRLLEEYETAASLYGATIKLAEEADDAFLIARTHHMRGIISSYRGQPGESLPDYVAAEALYQQLGIERRVSDVQVDRCRAEANVGRLQQARECLQILEDRLLALEDYKRLSNTATNLGFVAEQLSELTAAEAAHGRALDYAGKVEASYGALSRTQANSHSQRARLRYLRGADRAALLDYLEALRLLTPTGAVRLEANVMQGVAAVYARLGYHRLAEAFIRSARTRYESLQVRDGVIATWLREAQLAADAGESGRAHQAIATARELLAPLENHTLLLGSTVITRAQICRRLNDHQCAQEAAAEARDLRRQGMELPDLDAQLALVEASLARGRDERAVARRRGREAMGANSPAIRAEAALLLGDIAQEDHNLGEAASYFEAARSALSGRRGEGTHLLPDQSALQGHIYRRLVDALTLQETMAVEERASRAVALVQQIAGSARNPLLSDPRLQEQRENAAARLASRIESEGDTLPLLESLLEIETSLEQAEQRTQDPVVDLAGIRRLLPERSAMLVYLLGRRSSVGFRIDGTSVTHFALPPRDRILAEAGRWREAIKNRTSSEADVAASLGQALLPAGACCRQNAERLLIFEPGELTHVPFSALIPEGESVPLGVRSSVVRLVSLSPNAGDAPRRNLRFAGIGDPVVNGADPRLPVPASLDDESHGLGRLAGSDREWQVFKAGTQVRELTGFSATKSLVLHPEILGAEILHIATHAIGDARYGIGSGFFLSRFDRAGNPIDGFVSSLEILVRAVDARLVVLSACDTAYSGSGLSLAESFVRAGAETVVASLWPVSNRATQTLMEAFYQELAKAPDSATAMQRAQQRLRETPVWNRSYFWAAFEIYSHPGAL